MDFCFQDSRPRSRPDPAQVQARPGPGAGPTRPGPGPTWPRVQDRPGPDPGPFAPICWTLGRSGPFVGPWAVRAHLLDPGPFRPICWTLGRSGPFDGPWAVRAHWLGMSILQGQWACPMSRLGMSHAQVGHVPCPGWACPMPGWACPMSRLRLHAQGPILGPIWGPIFCLGPIWVPFGDPFF